MAFTNMLSVYSLEFLNARLLVSDVLHAATLEETQTGGAVAVLDAGKAWTRRSWPDSGPRPPCRFPGSGTETSRPKVS